MKVDLLTNFSPKTGAGKYALQLHKELIKKNIDSTLFNMGVEKIKFKKVKNIKPKKYPLLSTTLNYFFPPKIPFNNITHLTNQFLSPIKKDCSVTCLDLIPLYYPKQFNWLLQKALAKSIKSIKNAKLIICISEHTKNDLINKFNIPNEKIKVIYLGYDKKIFKPVNKTKARKKLNLPLNEKIVLHVGSEEKRKNVETLLKACNKRKYKLIRIGNQYPQVSKLESTLDLNITHYNKISEKELALFYSAADVLVFPSTYEGFGFPVLEAIACGCPVITTKLTSLPEVGGDAVIYLKNPFDENELIKKIDNLLASEKVQKKYSVLGIKQARKFSWKKCAEETIRIYKKLE